jgi:hypothetical protein
MARPLKADILALIADDSYLREVYILVDDLAKACVAHGEERGRNKDCWVPPTVEKLKQLSASKLVSYINAHAPRFSGRGWRALRAFQYHAERNAYHLAKWGELGCWTTTTTAQARAKLENLLAMYVVRH